jgi:twitching motility protein PilT
LLDSLLDAIVRLDGDALVMHVGEKPYVVTTSEARHQFRGPLAWGQVELSTRVLTVDAVAGMLGQILPADQRSALDEYGATEYEVIAANHPEEQFTIVAARGGDDIWIEMRRRPVLSADASAVIANLREDVPVAVEDPPAEAAELIEAPPALLNEPPSDLEEQPGPVSMFMSADPDAAELSAPDEIDPEPLGVDLDVNHLIALDPPAEFDQAPFEEPYSIDLDSDREIAEELLAIDADFEGGLFGDSHDWHDDVMTEGELGELLRATATAVIAGEIGPEESTPPSSFAQTEPLLAEDTVTEAASAAAAVGVIEPSGVERHVSRVTEELPLLVAYQIEHDPVQAEFSSHEVRTISESEEIATEAKDTNFEVVQELPAPVPMEIVVVLAAESTGSANEPASSGSVPPDAPAAPEVVDERDAEKVAEVDIEKEADEDGAEAGASVALDGETNDEDEDVAPPRPHAVVLPLTRQPKSEGGGEARVPVATTLQRLLRLAGARGAGTVYVVANSAPLVRIDGEFSTLEGEPALSAAFVDRLLSEVAPSARGESPSAEWLIDVPEIGRVRCVAFRDHRGPGVIFRMVPARAISADQLGLSAEVQALCSEADGLILVTGGRATGKSTLLTSFVDLINRTRSDHIITTEAQIDFIHEHKRSFISQREVRGEDAMVSAVRAACREEPDVLIVEDLRTQELAALALDAAESGRLVFASVPGVSTPSALERLIELFPAERREKVQASLAGTLRGIVSQVLLRKLRGGRVAAREVLINTPAVAGLILEGKTFQLPAALENGRTSGMISFAESLASLVREGTVHPAHAYRKAPNRDQFMAALRRSGVDTAIAERLG